jgi:hypothetical protein
MTTHRYQQDTISGQVWETSITDNGCDITLIATHMARDTGKVIKQVQKIITRTELVIYQSKNQIFHLETYES